MNIGSLIPITYVNTGDVEHISFLQHIHCERSLSGKATNLQQRNSIRKHRHIALDALPIGASAVDLRFELAAVDETKGSVRTTLMTRSQSCVMPHEKEIWGT